MYVTDPVADMLTRIRNAIMAKKAEVLIPHSKLKIEVARILLEEGYILGYEVKDGESFNWIHIQIKYVEGTRRSQSVISGIKRVSKPGRRIYTKHREIPWVLSGMGIVILTTPKGVMSDRQARKNHVGGEILAYVW